MIYLLPIGGTGVRVAKSLVYLCMTGCFDDNQFKIMCIDSDDVNGDVKALENILKLYKDLPDDLFPEIKLAKIDGEERCVWSPLSGDKRKDKRSSMKDMILESQMDKKTKKVLEFLYTKSEREKILEGGFYGHTSIGSYFMAQEVVKDGKYTEVWHGFFDGIKEDDKIFIVGSIFGGTGASGVPTIARLIKNNPETSKNPIGSIFVMPYFKPGKRGDDDLDLPIDWTSFTTKTKTALSFYLDQQFDKIFSAMYFVGEESDEDFMWVEYNDSGIKQRNKANPIEVYAATAILDFAKSEIGDNLITKFLTKEVNGQNISLLTQEMLNEIADAGCFVKMTKFLDFSIIYNKYLYPCIKQKFAAEKWYSSYKKISDEDAKILKDLCVEYINWIKELVVVNDTTGKTDYSEENNKLLWYWYKNYAEIFDSNKELNSHKRAFTFNKEQKVFDLDGLEELSSIVKNQTCKSGREIIEYFSNEKAPNRKANKDTSDLKQLMLDIMELC